MLDFLSEIFSLTRIELYVLQFSFYNSKYKILISKYKNYIGFLEKFFLFVCLFLFQYVSLVYIFDAKIKMNFAFIILLKPELLELNHVFKYFHQYKGSFESSHHNFLYKMYGVNSETIMHRMVIIR